MRKNDWIKAAISVIIAQVAGGIGSIFTLPSIPTWYATLAKPALTPPGWVFGPVWTTLYILMGIAAFLVWREVRDKDRGGAALVLYGGQLVLNVLWSVAFFGFHRTGLSLGIIALLWIGIAGCVWTFSKVSRPAAWLMAPYLAWVTFAAYLNLGIFLLN